jgi:Lhr-like helicase
MKTLFTPSLEGRKAERALQKAVARVLEENRRLGIPVAVMRKGKAVSIPAEEAMRAVREERAAYGAKRR